jgi:eukaryotic-like serine/threonine-protein kinase
MNQPSVSHYRILNKLGAGGMGEVYLAEDTQLNREVAIKFLPDESSADEGAGKRLVKEARAAAKLDHPNICSIYEVGEEDGRSFIVMQYVKGETLAARIQRKPMGVQEALDVAAQVADALAEAHSHGIIHRDIKPLNIMVTGRGQAKVMGFGLAKMIRSGDLTDNEAETQTLLTEPGLIMGTVPYMSPEQVAGEMLDARSDIFSFGAVLYEVVTGTQPFASDNAAAIISTILTKEPPPLARYSREVPSELERIVSKALCKDREQRYQTARDLLIDLKSLSQKLTFEAKLGASTPARSIGESKAVSDKKQTTVETVPQPAATTAEVGTRLTRSSKDSLIGVRRHRFRFAGVGLVLIALAGGGIYLVLGHRKAIDSLAVLPFTNVSGDPNTEYLSDGITESLINNLSQLPNLTVMSRNSVFRYKGQEADAQAAGRDLKVQAVLTGRMVQRGDSLSIIVEFIDVRNNSHIWGEQYNRRLFDIFAVQGEIARQISERLRLRLSGDDQRRLTKHDTENTEAYQLYLKGRYYWNKRSAEGTRKAIEYFRQATDADPNYALAYAGLADSYGFLTEFSGVPKEETSPKARAAARKALELDDTLAEAHISLAVNLQADMDWSGAEREFKRAIELNPNYPTAHHWYSEYLQVMGRLDESKAEIKRRRRSIC